MSGLGWGSSSASYILTPQAWKPEFRPSIPTEKVKSIVIPALGKQSQDDLWGLLLSQSSQPSASGIVRDSLKK